MSFDPVVREHVERVWADDVVPSLFDYIEVPCVSVAYDADWKAHGHLDRAMEMIRRWSAARAIVGLSVEVKELPGRTPLMIVEVPAFGGGPSDDTVLLYGHMDKQPEMTGWRDDLGPWKPVLEGHRLYGRGGADDGYSTFASLLAIEATQRAGLPHARCVVLIEASEESGSPDLAAHLDALGDRLGTPTLVLCLDSGCLDDQRVWVTTSLRGLAGGDLRVDVLREGVHSGAASGVVPSSFRIARELIERVEDGETGRLRLPELHVDVPADRRRQAEELGREFPIEDHFPWLAGVTPMTSDPTEQVLATTWRPTLSLTGVDGIPPVTAAGNVLRPQTTLHLSFRLPPTCNAHAALVAIERALTTETPYGAKVELLHPDAQDGWNAPEFAPWLEVALAEASMEVFGNPHMAMGEGGSIPFMGMLGRMFPDAQFVITGVLGPGSNAHGPNEFLDVAAAVKLTECLTYVLRSHATR